LPKTGATDALLLTAKSDGRVFFMIPWYGMTLIGTTDDNYCGNIDRVSVEAKDIEYLLTEVNRILKDVNWEAQDIIGKYAGLRVLKQSEKKSPSAISRDWELITSKNGMLTSIGGKFTSARADAECIVDRLCRNLGVTKRGCTFGKPFPWLPEGDYRLWSDRQLEKASGLGIDNDSAEWLLRRHGKRVDEVFRLCEDQPDWASRILPDVPFIIADLVYCARNEMVVHLEDLLRRRIPLLILAKLKWPELLQLAEIAAKELNWDETGMNREYENCRRFMPGANHHCIDAS
jgi:glycerol-3-phosphate dehydrogenase